MKGDFTRSTFRSEKHYNSVRMQQGRVQMDADWNEQIEIQQHLERTEARDVIGLCGVPKSGGGFAIGVSEDGGDLTISAGRIYVDGILCENEQGLRFTQQPDLPAAEPIGEPGTYLVYLDVWEQHITALEDDSIREVALGGPDTATRTRTVWQVKLLPLGAPNAGVDCETSFEQWDALSGGTRGRLIARAQPETTSDNPCIIEPGAGYRRLENQLYRVEIHADSASGQPTFKWSRDNGSIVKRWNAKSGDDLTISSPGRDAVLGFATDQWIELTDTNRELLGRPGTLVQLASAIGQTLTIKPATASDTVDFGQFNNQPKVRRWDMPGTTGPIEVSVPASNNGWIALEDGVEIKFDLSGPFNTGDYWLIPARTATGDVEWPFVTPQPPQGIQHHYCRLAILNFDGESLTAADIEDCRVDFPSLTTICAEDVCFDNGTCDLAGAETVQDALDRLCRERDLRHHNKHLHGWGIVCGLHVTCGPNDERRDNVTIHSGYAIDCEGNDILVERDETYPVMDMVRRLIEQNPNLNILDERGNGEVALRLDREGEGGRYSLEKYDPTARNDFQALLAGTLLLDFYNDCIKRVQDFLREELTPPEEEKDQPAGPVFQRLSALTNLLAQPINPKTGQHIYISPREHVIMRDFYFRLRELLTSETFCAMFANARPFPDYPLRELGLTEQAMDTIFGRSQHIRLRIRPGATEVYSVGPGTNPLQPDTMINRYDVSRNLLLERINPIAGAQVDNNTSDTGTGAVQDVAFSPDGRLIYMIAATKNDANTFFRVGEIGRTGVTWRPIVTICGIKLVSLATTAADRTNVYAVGLRKQTITENGQTRTEFRGAGLYQINPDNVDPNMEPMPGMAFNTFGHLEVSANGRAFITYRADNTQPTSYNMVRCVQLPQGTILREFQLPASGSDDIALFTADVEARTETLFVVTGPDSNSRKQIHAFNIANGQPLGEPVPMPNTTIRIEPFAPQRMLLVSLESNYSLRMINMDSLRQIDGYLLPTQVSPISIVTTSGIRGIRNQRVYVLNQLSNTITTVAGNLFEPGFRFRLDVLAAYRKGVIEAFADLLAGFLQYVKDCLCDHFLVKCPECDEDDIIYLACISIRDRQVYKVCNFSQRKYVKSFKTVGYWLSLVPIVPLFDRLIEEFCCMILPDLFGRFTVDEFDQDQSFQGDSRVRGEQLRQGLGVLQGFDIGTMLRSFTSKSRTAASVATASTGQPSFAPPFTRRATFDGKNLINQSSESAEAQLKDAGVSVRRATYDPIDTPSIVSTLPGFFRSINAGSQVTLYEENGQVRYYSVSGAEPSEELRSQVDSLSRQLNTRDTEMQRLQRNVEEQRTTLDEVEPLKARLSDTQRLLSSKDEEIGALRKQVESLESKQTELTSRKFADLEAELKELRSFREEVTRFMRRPPS